MNTLPQPADVLSPKRVNHAAAQAQLVRVKRLAGRFVARHCSIKGRRAIADSEEAAALKCFCLIEPASIKQISAGLWRATPSQEFNPQEAA